MYNNRHLRIFFHALMIGITGCTDAGDTQNAAQIDKDFVKTMGIADSLYNCMQFRDAYKLYLQLLYRPPDTRLPEYAGQHVWRDEGL